MCSEYSAVLRPCQVTYSHLLLLNPWQLAQPTDRHRITNHHRLNTLSRSGVNPNASGVCATSMMASVTITTEVRADETDRVKDGMVTTST